MTRWRALGPLAVSVLVAWPGLGSAADGGLQGRVTTVAGGNHHGHGDDFSTLASFDGPRGIAVDRQGDAYVSDYFNSCIRIVGTDGMVRTIAGGGVGDADGRNDAVRFCYPTGLAVAGDGTVYVADTGNHRIRRLSYDKVLRVATVTTVAGGLAGNDDGVGAAAEFNGPQGLAVDGAGTLVVADSANHRIRRIQADGRVTTVAGSTLGLADGVGPAACFARPEGIAVAPDGAVFVADTGNHAVRRLGRDGRVTTVAGNGLPGSTDGVGRNARFQDPTALVVTDAGVVYVADTGNSAVRRIGPDGTVTTVAGGHLGCADGLQHDARLAHPLGVALERAGGLLVADTDNNRIRRVD